MPMSPEVDAAVRAIFNNRHGELMAAIAKTGDEVRRDFAKRGLRGPMVAATLVDKVAGHVWQHVEAVVTEVLEQLDSRGAFDDEVAEWLIFEVSRLVDGLGDALRSAARSDAGSGYPAEAARKELAETAEMKTSQIRSQALSQITTRQELDRLGPKRRAEAAAAAPIAGALDSFDAQIVTKLKDVCPTAAAAYEQGVRELEGPERLSYRGPVTELREALRETLLTTAPDAEVMQQEWYKQVKDIDGPTKAQRARYALQNARKSEQAVEADTQAIEQSEELFGRFVRSVYGRTNVSTHTHAGRAEAEKMRGLVRIVLHDLLGL